VWQLRVQATVIDDDGNMGDVCVLATLAALIHFRRPFVEIAGGQVTVVCSAECFVSQMRTAWDCRGLSLLFLKYDNFPQHTLESHEPVPLSIHHRPFCITLAIFPSLWVTRAHMSVDVAFMGFLNSHHIFHRDTYVVDPSRLEEAVCGGCISGEKKVTPARFRPTIPCSPRADTSATPPPLFPLLLTHIQLFLLQWP
jgi:exosome complex RNA-binding protein Rrp42 (RNase PH superfamily)